MLRIDAHRKAYVTPDMHDVISSSILRRKILFVLYSVVASFSGHHFERSDLNRCTDQMCFRL